MAAGLVQVMIGTISELVMIRLATLLVTLPPAPVTITE